MQFGDFSADMGNEVYYVLQSVFTDAEELPSLQNILFGADPSQISIAGVQFALTNSEIMQVMGREEIHRSPTAENEDRMARIASHLVR